MLRPVILLLLAALCCTSCSVFKGHGAPKAAPVKFPANAPVEPHQPVMVGTIRMVNPDERFAVVEGNGLSAMATGTSLKCFRDGVEVGTVVIGLERRHPFLIGEIVAGLPQKGDQVMQ